MEELIQIILNDNDIKEQIKVLLVKHGYYKQARDLSEQSSIIIDLEEINKPKQLSKKEIVLLNNNLKTKI